MNRVIIGSSNVYRFYNKTEYKDYNEYMLAKCTDIKCFEALMMNLGRNDKEVIVAVLENFLDKAGSQEETEEGRLLALGETIESYCKIIQETANNNPRSKFFFADPIWRPKITWYQALYDDIIVTCKESFAIMKLLNVTRAEVLPEGCQQFEDDQVHLTKDSAKIYVEGILKSSENYFRAPFVDLGQDDEEMPREDDDGLEVRLDRLEGHVKARQANDNLILARLREESDATANKLKEDRVVITGITSKTVPPSDPEQRKVWIKKIASDIFESLIPGFDGQIHFVNQAKNRGTHIPLIEVKLDSIENAGKLRKAFAEKKKSNVDLGRIFVANSVGLSTRVRVDILKAIAKKISGQSISAHVVAFISRPVMHVKSNTGATDVMVPKTFTFVDAVAQYGQAVSQFELADAYRRAGTSFKGQMEQMFVILRERDDWSGRRQQQQQQRGAGGSGFPRNERKRQREDDDAGEGTSRSGFGKRGRGNGNRRPYRGGRGNGSNRGYV